MRRLTLTLTQKIWVGLFVGIVAGGLISRWHPAAAVWVKPLSGLFLRMIKMIIAPLIFGSLVAGIAGAGHVRTVGRMGLRALLYFEVVTTFALAIGLLAVNFIRPGVGVNLPAPIGATEAVHAQTWDQIVLHVIPTSVIQAM